MIARHSTAHCKTCRQASPFMRELRASFRRHTTFDTLWSLILGDKVPSKRQAQILLDHFRSHGWNVTPRDFIRGTAASNHPVFINLRLLRHSLDRSVLEILFFGSIGTTNERDINADKKA